MINKQQEIMKNLPYIEKLIRRMYVDVTNITFVKNLNIIKVFSGNGKITLLSVWDIVDLMTKFVLTDS